MIEQKKEFNREEIYSKILNINDEEIKEMALIGLSTIGEENRKAFNAKYKLDGDYYYFNRICNDVLEGIFSFSSYIHIDVLFKMVKRIVTMERQENWEYPDDIEEVDEAEVEYKEEIINCVKQEMETLYNLDEDEIFSELLCAICNILCLYSPDYGVSNVEDDENSDIQGVNI